MCALAGFSSYDHAAAMPVALVDPIAWLSAENARHRQLCDMLADVSKLRTASPALLRRLAETLATEMALHVADEAEDLFPRLCQRMEADDEIARVLGILTADHDADQSAVRDLQQAFSAAAEAGVGPADWPGLGAMIGQFITHERRHIALVNAVVLPIARLRLTPSDQHDMARSMAARRAH
jgi:iron-sulfur cluster repair protein YtfE (RIC family)